MADRLSDTAGFRVHAIDVGQGDSILLEGPEGDTMLVDSGPWQDNGETVLDYLDRNDIDHLDHLVTTHYDADHIGGHAAIIDEYGPDHIGKIHGPNMSGVEDSNSDTMDKFKLSLNENELGINELQEGSDLHLNDVDIDVLNPSPDSGSTDRNENSIVMYCTYGEHSALLAGDIEHGTEARLVEEYPDELSQVDAVKIAHHGSKGSTSEEFLAACETKTAIFSHAEQNRDGHPDKETLYRTADGTDTAVSTALHGSTVLDFDGDDTITIQNVTSTANFAVMTRYCREYSEDFDTALVEDNALAYEALPQDIPLGVVNDTSNVQLPKEVQKLRDDKKELQNEKEKFQDRYEDYRDKYGEVLDKYEDILGKYEGVLDENEDLREQVDELQTTLNDFTDTNQPEAESEASTTVEMTQLTTAEKINVAIRTSETVEEVRQMVADYPAATERLHEFVQTDRNKHVTTSTQAAQNAQEYRQAEHRVERASVPLSDRFQTKLPSFLGGVDAEALKDQQLAEETEDVGPTECHPAVDESKTAAEKRIYNTKPSDDLKMAEEAADTAVDTAETGKQLCETLRNTPGAHKDFLYALTTPNAHHAHEETESENSNESTQTQQSEQSIERSRDNDRGLRL